MQFELNKVGQLRNRFLSGVMYSPASMKNEPMAAIYEHQCVPTLCFSSALLTAVYIILPYKVILYTPLNHQISSIPKRRHDDRFYRD